MQSKHDIKLDPWFTVKFEQMYGDRQITIESLARVVQFEDLKHSVPYTPFGCCITPDGTVYALTHYATHGVVAAVLYPEVAAEFEVPQPIVDEHVDELPKMAYQHFELECAPLLPLLRVSAGRMGSPHVSWSEDIGLTEEQIEAFRLFCIENHSSDEEYFCTGLMGGGLQKVLKGMRETKGKRKELPPVDYSQKLVDPNEKDPYDD